MLAVSTGLTGNLCLPQTSYSSQGTYPTGYTYAISISIITLTITLSSDSNTITVTNSLGSSCGTVAVRKVATTTVHSDAGQQYMNMIILSFLLFLSIAINN
jgi:hypothetical protein